MTSTLSRFTLLVLAVTALCADHAQAGLVSYEFEARVNSTIGSLFGVAPPAFGSLLTGRLTYLATAAPTTPGVWTDALGAESLLSVELSGHIISTVAGELDAFSEFGWVEFGNAEGTDFPEGLLKDSEFATHDGYMFLAMATDSVALPDNSLEFPLDPLSQWDSSILRPIVVIADNVGGGYVEGVITSLTPVVTGVTAPEPSTGALAVSCCLAIVGLARRRRRAANW